MKAFDRILAAAAVWIVLSFLAVNLLPGLSGQTAGGRPYRVEINRLALAIEEQGLDSIDLSACDYVTEITVCSGLRETDSDCVFREINGTLYCFAYTANQNAGQGNTRLMVNLFLGILSAGTIGILFFVRIKILLPFEQLKEVPYELSKGNLTLPIQESKNRFFGRFLWGIDLLREHMEQQKLRELKLQKEKKLLLLSLSHDVKTPLSAIKLYAKALSKGLYHGKEKQLEIAEAIHGKADEIEAYVSQIITASREDFLSLEVHNTEFYLSDLVNSIQRYYMEKLRLLQTEFRIGAYQNCLLKGDIDRSIEAVQNVMENAIKYGDGKQICLQFSQEEGCLILIVRNSGCTLCENDLLHMFESFWRGTNAEKEKGSGLGLYICRQLMHNMHGEIYAEIQGDFLAVHMVFLKQ